MLANPIMTEVRNCLECGVRLTGENLEGFCRCCISRLVFDPAFTDSPAAETTPQRVIGDFELVEEIGRGGMGVVWRARQRTLNRVVALKFIAAGPFASREFRERFRQEAATTARLQHPNIVAVYEAGEHDGHAWLAMEFVAGRSLADLAREGPLPAREAAGLVRTIARAIQRAHAHGVIHRDIKPSNILLDAVGEPRVTDFGLARDLTAGSDLTLTGQALGSPSFCAPEQVAGNAGRKASGPESEMKARVSHTSHLPTFRPAGFQGLDLNAETSHESKAANTNISFAVDIYGLGAILYHLLTGRPPFLGTTIGDTLRAVLHDEPVSPRRLNPAVPHDLETICLKCLEKEPSRRYATALVLADDLGRFLDGEPVLARPVTRPERAWRWCRRKPAFAAALSATLLLLLVVLVGGPLATLRIARERAGAEENIVRQYVATGSRLEESGDTVAALPWFAAAALREQVAGQLPLHQLRLGWSSQGLPVPEFLVAFEAYVTATAWSADGRWLAFGDGAGWVRVFNPAQDQSPVMAVRHGAGIGQIAFAAGGSQLLTVAAADDAASRRGSNLDARNEVRVWAVPDGKLALTLAHPAPVTQLAYTPAGDRVAAIVPGHGIWIWQVTDRHHLATVADNTTVLDATFSTDGRALFLIPAVGRVERWEVGAERASWSQEHPSARHLALDSTGSKLASYGRGPQVQLLDPVTGASGKSFGTGSSLDSPGVNHVEFSPDGFTLLVAGRDAVARLWDLSTGEPRRELRYVSHFTRAVDDFTARFGPGGSHLLLAGNAGVRLFNAQTLEPMGPGLLSFTGVPFAEFAPNGGRLLTVGLDSVARVWPWPPRPPAAVVHPWPGPVDEIAATPDGNQFAVAGEGEAAVFQRQKDGFREQFRVTVRPGAQHNGVEFSPDGHRLVVTGNGELRVWDSATGQPVTAPLIHAAGGEILARFTPDSGRLVSAGGDGTIVVWKLADEGANVERRLTNGSSIRCLEVSPDGRQVLVGASTGGAQLWQLETGEPAGPPVLQGSAVLAVAFSADGRLAASAGEDGFTRVWKTSTGEEICSLLRHFGYVASVKFSADGRHLLTASADRLATIWDLSRGEPVVRMRHGDYVNEAVFSPDERLVATASEQGLRLWDATTGEALSPWLTSASDKPQAWKVRFLPNGLSVLACSQYAHNATARTLPGDRREKEAWLDLSAVVSGQHITAAGQVEVVPPAAAVAAQQRLNPIRPRQTSPIP